MAAAVRALLGPDSRFVEGEDGTWSLADPHRALTRPLRLLDYAVVDLETTGSLRWRQVGVDIEHTEVEFCG